jgi:hypothetical protein
MGYSIQDGCQYARQPLKNIVPMTHYEEMSEQGEQWDTGFTPAKTSMEQPSYLWWLTIAGTNGTLRCHVNSAVSRQGPDRFSFARSKADEN